MPLKSAKKSWGENMDTFLSFLGSRYLRTKAAFQAFGLGLGVLLLCLPAFAQLNLGSIAGTVTDASGGVIAGANVTVTDVERGVSRTLTTDSAGEYSATSLTPGSYSVRAQFTGFQTLNRTGIAVGVGQAVRVDLAMQPGAQTQTVTVTEAVPLVDTSNEVLSSTVESCPAQPSCRLTAACTRKCWTSSRESMGTRAEIRRTTKPTAPVAWAITICSTAWRTATYSSTPDL